MGDQYLVVGVFLETTADTISHCFDTALLLGRPLVSSTAARVQQKTMLVQGSVATVEHALDTTAVPAREQCTMHVQLPKTWLRLHEMWLARYHVAFVYSLLSGLSSSENMVCPSKTVSTPPLLIEYWTPQLLASLTP